MATLFLASVVPTVRFFPLAPGPYKVGRDQQDVDDDSDREKTDRRSTRIRDLIRRDELVLRDWRWVQCAGGEYR